LKAENLLQNFSALSINLFFAHRFCASFLRRLSAKLERVINWQTYLFQS
jgi:hypothetical protein